MQLKDKFGRKITYLRLAVTDRCNFNCQYCMPLSNTIFVPKKELLSYKEMYRITRILSELGVNKIRLTGGEPFVRKDFIAFLEKLTFNKKLKEINITTNGSLIESYISKLEALGIKAVNLSIDSLKEEKFAEITKKNALKKVIKTYKKLLQSKITLKLNIVVQAGINTDEIIDFIELTKNQKISVRFIEEMPFNGKGFSLDKEIWNAQKILCFIKSNYAEVEALISQKSSTSNNYKIPNYKGNFGIIPAYTRTICGNCNRIRITATGILKNCLFDQGVFNIKDVIRKGATDKELKKIMIKLIHKKPKNGFIAEKSRKNSISESMSTIGG